MTGAADQVRAVFFGSLLVCAITAAPLPARAIFAASSEDAGVPVEIEADALEVDQTAQTAIFTGHVHAVQGDMTLNADRLQVDYVRPPSAPGGGETAPAGAVIETLDAQGHVVIVSRTGQTMTGDWARYDVDGRELIMGGNVILQQGDSVVRGTHLTWNLETGLSRVSSGPADAAAENSGTGGERVRGLFQAP